MIPILEPYLDHRERENLLSAFDSGWISSAGSFVVEFEEKFASLYKSNRYATSVSNGTVAIELALKSLNIGIGCKVLVPNFTFGATVNAVLNVGAQPVLFEPSVRSWNLDIELFSDVGSLADVDAIIFVSIYGVQINQAVYKNLRENYPHIAIIEDCAESFGTQYGDEFSGGLADVATFSFFGNKTITTGEGGMVTFRDEDCYLKALNIKNHGMSPDRKYYHTAVGSNYRMTNLQAALGVSQLDKIDYIFSRKKEITGNYHSQLKGVTFQYGSNHSSNVIWLNTILFNNKKQRDAAINNFRLEGIDYRLPFSPMSDQPAFLGLDVRGAHGVADSVHSRGLSVPSSVTLSEKSQQRVIDAVNKIV